MPESKAASTFSAVARICSPIFESAEEEPERQTHTAVTPMTIRSSSETLMPEEGSESFGSRDGQRALLRP